jgi:hypothetical protein
MREGVESHAMENFAENMAVTGRAILAAQNFSN